MTAPTHYFINLLLVSVLLLPLYHSIKREAIRECLMIMLGLYMIFLFAPRLLLFWPPYWCVIWGLNRVLGASTDERSKRMMLWVFIAISLLPMFLWKLYSDFYIHYLNEWLHGGISRLSWGFELVDGMVDWVVPLGLSFSVFRAADLLVCRYLDVLPPLSFRRVLHYGLFPPVLIVGPIAQFSELNRKKDQQGNLAEDIAYGMYRIVVGSIKLFVIAIPLSGSESSILNFRDHTVGHVWFSIFVYSWYFYLNFSGFADLAIGTSRLYGIKLRENFSFPYFRPNLQQFWAHWHMSLTSSAQRNVFIPLGGFRKNRQYIATFITMMVIALWHNINVSLFVYGVCHATVLIVLRYTHMRFGVSESTGMRYLLGAAATYVFVAMTMPLIILDFTDVVALYGHLIGW